MFGAIGVGGGGEAESILQVLFPFSLFLSLKLEVDFHS